MASTGKRGFLGLGRTARRGAEPDSAFGKAESAVARALSDNAFQFTGLLEPDGTMVAVNQAALALCGIREADAIGKPFWETPWWSHSEFEQLRLKKAIISAREGHTVRYEATHLDQQGATHAIEFSLKPVFDAEGEVIWLIPEGLDVTELRRTQASFSDVVSSIPGIVYQFRIDCEGRESLTFVSQSIYPMFGVTSEEAMADINRIWNRIHPDDMLTLRQEITRSAVTLTRSVLEVRVRLHDGTPKWARIESIPRRDAGGSITWNGVVTDITESRTLRESLDETEARLREFIAEAPLGVHLYGLNEEGELLFQGSNQAAQQILRDDHSLILGQPAEEALPELMYTGMTERLRSICKDGGNWSTEQFAIKGRLFKGVFEMHVFQAGPGQCALMFADISARQKAQRELADSERRFRNFIENTAEGILLVEFNPPVPASLDAARRGELERERGAIVECNRAFLKLFGVRDKSELSGMWLADFEREYRHERRNGFQALDGQTYTGHEYSVRGAGDVVRVISESGFYQVQHGLAVRRWSMLRDVTQLKRSQEEMERARELAEAASRAKSEFLANMSHEVRTPLNAIALLGQLLEASELDPDQRSAVVQLRQATSALTSLVDDLMDFSRIEAGKLSLQEKDFDLAQVVEEAAALLAIQAGAKDLELTTRYPGHLPRRWRGDAGRIRQVVVNLAGNAVKFTSQGMVSIAVEALGEGAELEGVAVTISDTGPGIEPAKLESIFEPFRQVDTSITRVQTGLGLGLSISRKLAELMKGRIEVESRLGEGSVFRLVLPLKASKGAAAAADAPQVRTRFDGTSILLVEDNRLNRHAGRRLLEGMGCRVETAADGEDGAAKASAGGFDLILMDCQMPKLDGLSATRRIRKCEEGGQRTPIIALTAHALEAHRQECIESGMDDYLSKPVDMAALQSVLSKWLS